MLRQRNRFCVCALRVKAGGIAIDRTFYLSAADEG